MPAEAKEHVKIKDVPRFILKCDDDGNHTDTSLRDIEYLHQNGTAWASREAGRQREVM